MLTAAEILEWNAEGVPLPLLAVQGLVKHFPVKRGLFGRPRAGVRVVDGVSFSVVPGETLGIVGESGCGKSTIARLLMHLLVPDAGAITLDGAPVGSAELPLARYRTQVQMVFQDNYASLNPRMTVEESIASGPAVHGLVRREAIARARSLLARVGLEPAHFAGRYPHELSEGQPQRVNIARALALQPRVLILDEPVTGLDKSVEAEVLDLLFDLKEDFGLTYVFMSQDPAVMRFIADRVMVLYLGRIAEIGPTEALYRTRRHPYTTALFDTMPSMDPKRQSAEARPSGGGQPNPIDPPPGCRFHPRCRFAEDCCRVHAPMLHAVGPNHFVACQMFSPGSGHSAVAGGLRTA